MKKSIIVCTQCGNKFERADKHINEAKKNNWKIFCSKECLAASRVTSVNVVCGHCTKPISRTQAQFKRSQSGDCYCSRSCATAANNKKHKSGENHHYWTGGSSKYRPLALRTYGCLCQNPNCVLRAANITVPDVLLDVHHKDHNRKNNKIENLQVLCVYCHAVETRTKSECSSTG